MYQRRGSRILRGTAATLSVQPYLGGDAAAPDSGTVTIVTEGGETIVEDASISIVSTEARYDLDATQTADVNQLIATWTLSVSGVEGQVFVTEAQVVGDLLFTIAAARAWKKGGVAAFASSTAFPDAVLIEARDRIAEDFEEIIGTGLGLGYGRDVLDGNGRSDITLSEIQTSTVRACSVGGTALSDDELASGLYLYRYGRLARASATWPRGRQNVVVDYTFGLQPIPLALRQAALRVLGHQLIQSDIDDRQISQSTEFGVINYATAGKGAQSWYGIPDVDTVLERYREPMPL